MVQAYHEKLANTTRRKGNISSMVIIFTQRNYKSGFGNLLKLTGNGIILPLLPLTNTKAGSCYIPVYGLKAHREI